MHARPYGKKLQVGHYPFVLCFQEAMCKDPKPNNNGGAQEGCGLYLNTVRAKVSPFIF
jgi:hypothetical protein